MSAGTGKRSQPACSPPLGKGGQGGFLFSALLLFIILSACQAIHPRFTVEPLPRHDAAFQRPSGWTGGDGAYSVPLGRDRVLWLFGDSFIGRVQEGRRVDSRLINNAAAVQTGAEPSEDSLRFAYRTLPDGRPLAFLQPQDGIGWLWPYHGVRTAQGLFLFLLQIETAPGPAAFGFRLVSTWMGKIENPDEAPEHWVMTQRKIPWGHAGRLFGSAVLLKEEYAYVYGTVDVAAGGRVIKQLLLARVPAERLEDFSAWRFYAGSGWVADGEQAEPVCDDVAGELSVSHLPAVGRYVLVYTEGGLSESIAMRLARHPQGPWSQPAKVYRCPEADWNPSIFCYAGKGHPGNRRRTAGVDRDLRGQRHGLRPARSRRAALPTEVHQDNLHRCGLRIDRPRRERRGRSIFPRLRRSTPGRAGGRPPPPG